MDENQKILADFFLIEKKKWRVCRITIAGTQVAGVWLPRGARGVPLCITEVGEVYEANFDGVLVNAGDDRQLLAKVTLFHIPLRLEALQKIALGAIKDFYTEKPEQGSPDSPSTEVLIARITAALKES